MNGKYWCRVSVNYIDLGEMRASYQCYVVGVGGKVDNCEINDELTDLQQSNVLFPPDSNSTRALEVVPVHHHMDREIESDWHPGDGCVAAKLRIAE